MGLIDKAFICHYIEAKEAIKYILLNVRFVQKGLRLSLKVRFWTSLYLLKQIDVYKVAVDHSGGFGYTIITFTLTRCKFMISMNFGLGLRLKYSVFSKR